jgi:hypothetical protein
MKDEPLGPARDESDPLFNDLHDSRLARNRPLPPRPPKSFRIEKAGLGIRVIVTGWPADSIDVPGTSAFQYLLYWSEDVDQTTNDGILAGFARATLLSPAISGGGARNRGYPTLTAFYADPKYQTGYFYCTGVNVEGDESAPGNPVKIISGSGGTVPSDVEHFQASESGVAHNGTTISVVSYSFRVPTTGGEVDRVQFMYRNYPALNEFQEGESVRVTVGRGGTQTGSLDFPVGRRIGTGSITIVGAAVAGVGTQFLGLAAAAGGDVLEVLGARETILSVTDNENMTLVSAWAGPPVSGVTDWQVIASVEIFAVSEGRNGARRDDPENAPSATVVLDGDLSAPIAPTTVYVTPLDNSVRIEATQVAGTELDSYVLYRSTGTSVDAGMALSPPQPSAGTTQIDREPAVVNPIPGSLVQFEDSAFTQTEKEDGQAFVWYVTVRNVRGDESAAASAGGTCRLTTSQDVDPSLTGRVGMRNLLFDGFVGGTAGTTVADTNTSQDGFNGTSVGNLPGKPYGGSGAAAGTGAFVGYTRWHATTTGAAALPLFGNGNEVQIVAPGLAQSTYVFQEIDAWSIGLGGAAGVKITKGGMYVFSGLFRYDPVFGQPNGEFVIYIEQYANNTKNGDALRRYRDVGTQQLAFYAQGDANNPYTVPGSLLTTAWQRFYAVFQMDASLTTNQVRCNIALRNSNVGAIFMCRLMLNEGEDIAYWTGDMGNTLISQPVNASPPGTMGDGDGNRSGRILQP